MLDTPKPDNSEVIFRRKPEEENENVNFDAWLILMIFLFRSVVANCDKFELCGQLFVLCASVIVC